MATLEGQVASRAEHELEELEFSDAGEVGRSSRTARRFVACDKEQSLVSLVVLKIFHMNQGEL